MIEAVDDDQLGIILLRDDAAYNAWRHIGIPVADQV
jgi:hypothetical protein